MMPGASSAFKIAALVLAAAWLGAPQAAASDPSGATTVAAPGVVAVSSRLSEVGGVTRLVFDLSAPLRVATTFTADPDRLVVDLPDVNFQLEPGAGRRGLGLVRGFRCGTASAGHAKIVVELAGAAALKTAEVSSIAGGAPSRLTIELVATDQASFRAAVEATAVPERARRDPGPGAAPEDPRPVIVIDPGHGGVDPGAGGSAGVPEKTVVLDFADALATELTASGHYRIVLTRRDDRFVSLDERVRIARDAGAALMISVHADMLADRSVSGATVYTASDQASDADAGRFAAAENRADEAAGPGATPAPSPAVSNILLDFARRETRTYAHQFQRNLTGYWAKIAHLNRNPERSAGFRVLQALDVPSVLLELGYLSSDKDRAALTSAAWREKAAGAVAGAIDSFFAARKAEPRVAAGAAALP